MLADDFDAVFLFYKSPQLIEMVVGQTIFIVFGGLDQRDWFGFFIEKLKQIYSSVAFQGVFIRSLFEVKSTNIFV